MLCPNCGKDVKEDSYYCMYCGYKIPEEKDGSPETLIRNVLIARLNAIKEHDSKTIKNVVDEERYTKFDDWPPFDLQSKEALKNEIDAYKALKEYNYETRSWNFSIFGDLALATYIIKYQGKIRDLEFNIRSRVTSVLMKRDENWQIVHEHWSRFPQKEKSS